MRLKRTTRIVALSLTFLMLSSALSFRGTILAHAQPSPARLEVWSPDVHSSNITDLALTPGSVFTVKVNVTGAGPLVAFDATLNYNITIGPNVLQAVALRNELTGGLFDPNSNPGGCNILVAKADIDRLPGRIRFTAVTLSGCSEPGTGTLFSVTFLVTGMGSTSIDILQVSHFQAGTSLIGGVGNPPMTVNIPYIPFDGYFQNKPGTPPTPDFTYTPTNPQSGNSVQFNATQTRDADNPHAPNGGAQIEPIVYDSDNNQVYDSGESVIVGDTPAPGTPLGAAFNRPDPHFAYVDSDRNGHWDPGESAVYDANQNLVFDQGDWVIGGPSVTPGTVLTQDPKITYVDLHPNAFWDNGYVWDWGDGSGSLSTGNVTSHVFQCVPTVPCGGLFQVKLVVFDSDNGLLNRQILVVTVTPPTVHDVGVELSLSSTGLVVSDILGIQVGLVNHGTQGETVNFTVTCNCPGKVTVATESSTYLPFQGFKTFSYKLDTSNLSGGTYNITVSVDILDPVTGAIIQDSRPSDNSAIQSLILFADEFESRAFFTDGNSNPLPLDSLGRPSIQVILSNGIVRSTNPGQILAWANVTILKGEPVESIRLTDFLPMNWSISSNKPQLNGAVHVYLVSSSARVEITNSATISQGQGRFGIILTLSVNDLATTAAGGPLQPGESILVSVKLRYGLIGSVQDPHTFPRGYSLLCFPSLPESIGFEGEAIPAVLAAYAKVPGDVNGDLKVNIADMVLVAGSFGTTPNDANWNAAADLNQDGGIDLADLTEVGANFGQELHS